MNVRMIISSVLIVLAAILAFLPSAGNYSLHGNPGKLLEQSSGKNSYITADQLAHAVVYEDTLIRLIDIRSRHEYSIDALPGAINMPYDRIFASDLENLLGGNKRIVFYGDEYKANYAYVIATGLGFKNCAVLKGDLQSWYADVVNSRFTGSKISAKENALFETRYKARKLFNEFKSMPDSLKISYRANQESERKKLDGGCE